MTVISPVLLPAIIAGLIWLGAFRLWKRNAPNSQSHWSGALAVGAGYLAGHVALVSWPPMTPTSAEQWLAWLAVPIAAVCATEFGWGQRAESAWPMRIIWAAVVLWFLSASLREYRWSAFQVTAWIACSAIALAAIWDALDRLAKRRAGVTVPAVLWLVTTCASICFVLTGSALLGQLAGALAAILGAGAVLALWAPRLAFHSGAIGAWVLLFAGLVWQGHFYSELGLISALCLLAAPMFAWIGEWPALRMRKSWMQLAVRLVAVAAPIVIALILCARFWSAAQANEYVY